MHICKEDYAFQQLRLESDRKTVQQFRTWLLNSHNTYDQEVDNISFDPRNLLFSQ